MPLFPPQAPVAVVVNGRPLAAYAHAYVEGGRVYAPLAPLVTETANRFWFEGDTLILERGGRRVRVRFGRSSNDQLDAAAIPVGPVLRSLGVGVRYDRLTRTLVVTLPTARVVTTPTPLPALLPPVVPHAVFTPAETPTPRPLWTGSPMPRRTALPFPPPI